jgi:hypothetical protein
MENIIIPFGPYKGLSINEIPPVYLLFIYNQRTSDYECVMKYLFLNMSLPDYISQIQKNHNQMVNSTQYSDYSDFQKPEKRSSE